MRLVVAGHGPLRGRLEALATRAGGHIDFAGLVSPDALPGLLQAADLFVLPSIALEAFGLVTLEALACGTPVLATNRCASPEILGPLDGQLLIPGSDAIAIAEAILTRAVPLARQPGLRERCRRYAADNFSWDTTAGAFESLARELLRRRKGGS
jgi:glycosyltransferase involved in cell wall biosynthesis